MNIILRKFAPKLRTHKKVFFYEHPLAGLLTGATASRPLVPGPYNPGHLIIRLAAPAAGLSLRLAFRLDIMI